VPSTAAETGLSNTETVGWLLYVDYLVPFEVASVLLLVAMVGAVLLARKPE
jgi:NADH-quinone oxidoreductase subunit J